MKPHDDEPLAPENDCHPHVIPDDGGSPVLKNAPVVEIGIIIPDSVYSS